MKLPWEKILIILLLYLLIDMLYGIAVNFVKKIVEKILPSGSGLVRYANNAKDVLKIIANDIAWPFVLFEINTKPVPPVPVPVPAKERQQGKTVSEVVKTVLSDRQHTIIIIDKSIF